MRVAADGYIDCRSTTKIRTPGRYDEALEPVPESEALSFLLTHSFPGHRRIIRPLSVDDRKRIRLALWANSVSERMCHVDRVWRSITEPVPPPPDTARPHLIQVIQYESWIYPVYLDGATTRVIPPGGKSLAELSRKAEVVRLDRKTA